MTDKSGPAWLTRALHLAPILFFCLALWLLGHEISSIKAGHVWLELCGIPARQWVAAIFLTGCGYFVLTFYDVLGLRLVGATIPYRAAAEGAFLSFAISHNVGLGWISGGSMRERVYAPLGLEITDVARLTVMNSITFFIGSFVLLGAVLILEPQILTPLVALPHRGAELAGILLWVAIGLYLILSMRRRKPLGWGRVNLPVPGPRAACAQILMSTAEITLAGAALYVLLPADLDIGFPMLLGIYVVALGASVLTHIPGGLGVLETLVLWSLPNAPKAPLLAAMVAYRIAYYLVPLAVALVWMFGRAALRLGWRAVRSVGHSRRAVPLVAATLSCASGFYLLLSGATATIDASLHPLQRLVPLPLLELSHLAGSIAGLGLVILGGALYRRHDAARKAAVLLLAAGASTMLLRHETSLGAIVLATLAAALQASAADFHRSGSLLRNAISPGGIALALSALGVSVWVGFRAYSNIAYANDLWWQFAYEAGAPRFLRASLMAGLLGFALLAARLFGPAREGRSSEAADGAIAACVAASPETHANLALLGDKKFLRSASGSSFLMYQVEGRSWIAMGDPIGPRDEWPELIWQFLECADRAGGRPVFYETLGAGLEVYADAGLVAHKLGEEARINLAEFDLATPASKGFRAALKRGDRDGLSFEIVPASATASILDELEAVSRDWLQHKHAPEKGFSLGAFSRDYVRQFDCAVVRCEGSIVAFANLWRGDEAEEASMDLMRHRTSAPRGTMMYLMVNLILWAQQSRIAWFNLGMAPLTGLTQHRLAPKWHALGHIIYTHGERLYGFEGLRRFKMQFHPQWRARFAVCRPGLLTLGLGLADCARLISRPVTQAPRAVRRRRPEQDSAASGSIAMLAVPVA